MVILLCSRYFIIRMSKVRVSRFQWRRVRRERAGLGHGLFGGNRQVPPRSSTSLYRYTNPRQYTGSAFQWLVESRSGMRYKRVCEVEFCFKKVYSDSKTCNRARAARSLVFLAYVDSNCRVLFYIVLAHIAKFSVLPPRLRRARSPPWCSSSP